jgi:hypothetical protein
MSLPDAPAPVESKGGGGDNGHSSAAAKLADQMINGYTNELTPHSLSPLHARPDTRSTIHRVSTTGYHRTFQGLASTSWVLGPPGTSRSPIAASLVPACM